MKKYMLDYIRKAEEEEKKGCPDLLSDYRQHLEFFQHERLIHLIVTVLFSLLTLMSAGFTVITGNIGFTALTVVLFVMTAAYIKHYYFLENTVQKMYEKYDELSTMKDEEK